MTQPCKICRGTGRVMEDSELMERARKVRARLKEALEDYKGSNGELLTVAVSTIDELRNEVNTLRNKHDKIRRMFE